jgi:predicted metal-binding membrane protein
VPAFALAWLADRAIAGHAAAAMALAAAIFAAGGVYQLTPIKARCLARCRSPLGFLVRFGTLRGRARDLRVGLVHGAFCLGCCWALMTMLVAFGLMNLDAMIALALVVVVEKLGPWGRQFARLVGVVALAATVVVVLQPHLAPGLVPGGQSDMGRMSPP